MKMLIYNGTAGICAAGIGRWIRGVFERHAGASVDGLKQINMAQPTSQQRLVGCIFSILSYTQDVTRAYWMLKFQRILSMRHFPLALAILFALYTHILDFVS